MWQKDVDVDRLTSKQSVIIKFIPSTSTSDIQVSSCAMTGENPARIDQTNISDRVSETMRCFTLQRCLNTAGFLENQLDDYSAKNNDHVNYIIHFKHEMRWITFECREFVSIEYLRKTTYLESIQMFSTTSCLIY